MQRNRKLRSRLGGGCKPVSFGVRRIPAVRKPYALTKSGPGAAVLEEEAKPGVIVVQNIIECIPVAAI